MIPSQTWPTLDVWFDLQQRSSEEFKLAMSTKEHEKSGGKPRRRSRKPDQKGRKSDRQQKPKLDQRDEDQVSAMVISTDVPTEGVASPSELPASEASAPLSGEVASTDAPSIGAAAPADDRPISIQPVANAYENTGKAFQQTTFLTDAPAGGAASPSEVPSSEASAPLIGEVASTDTPSVGAVAPADKRPVSIQTIAKAYGSYTEKSFRETTSFVEKLVGVRSFGKAIEIQTEYAGQAYATFVAESQKICELYTELAKETFRSWQGVAAKVTKAGR